MLKRWLLERVNLLSVICYLLIGLFSLSAFAQNKISPISKISNDEVIISLIKLHSFTSDNNKSGHKYLVAEVIVENISDKTLNIGADYTMSLILIDSDGKEYKSGIKGAGIVSEFLTKFPKKEQDQKAYNLLFSEKFPPKTKAHSYLCGYEVPNNASITKFGVKKKNLFAEIKTK